MVENVRDQSSYSINMYGALPAQIRTASGQGASIYLYRSASLGIGLSIVLVVNCQQDPDFIKYEADRNYKLLPSSLLKTQSYDNPPQAQSHAISRLLRDPVHGVGAIF